MKNLMPFLILINFLWLIPAQANYCSPSEDNCEYYLCLEKTMKCGLKGFPLKLGYGFCSHISGLQSVSPRTQLWLKKTRYCLQDSLNQAHGLTCSNMLKKSVSDHVKCYVDNGYCELDKSEQKFIKKFILREFLKAPKYILLNAQAMLKNGCH